MNNESSSTWTVSTIPRRASCTYCSKVAQFACSSLGRLFIRQSLLALRRGHLSDNAIRMGVGSKELMLCRVSQALESERNVSSFWDPRSFGNECTFISQIDSLPQICVTHSPIYFIVGHRVAWDVWKGVTLTTKSILTSGLKQRVTLPVFFYRVFLPFVNRRNSKPAMTPSINNGAEVALLCFPLVIALLSCPCCLLHVVYEALGLCSVAVVDAWHEVAV